jgi:O-acetyl-ADP-ribose deacetylase (regulator of RNase III)
MIKIIDGDLLEAKEKYILHQTNSITNNAGGLALYLFLKYPFADVYKNRIENDVPGTVKVCGNGKDQRYVINAFGQFYPGPPKYQGIDTAEKRQEYFSQCLQQVSQIENLESIAFPYLIGCGLAKGKWENYLKMIGDFSNMDSMKDVSVIIYRKL